MSLDLFSYFGGNVVSSLRHIKLKAQHSPGQEQQFLPTALSGGPKSPSSITGKKINIKKIQEEIEVVVTMTLVHLLSHKYTDLLDKAKTALNGLCEVYYFVCSSARINCSEVCV